MTLFRRRSGPTRAEIRAARPLRNPNLSSTEREGGLVVLRVPLESRGGLYKLVSRCAPVPGEKEVELEEIGSFVWRLCDGSHTCRGIAEKLQARYRLTKAEAEASLITFIETLARRRYILLEFPAK